MHAVRGLIGEQAMNEALRGFVRDHAGPGGRPTSLELLDRLLRAAPEPERPLIEDWTKAIVLYDLRLDSASTERLADGRYEVKLRISASRASFDGSGRERPLALREAVDVGVFGARPGEGKGQAAALSLAKYELRQGVNELSIVVEGRPERAVVDPDVSRIDRNRFDNAMAVVEARAAAVSVPRQSRP
jgi:ABC-2 type transport system permease protein